MQGDPDSISDGTVSDTDEEEEVGEAADSTKHMRVDLDLTGRGDRQALGTVTLWEGTSQGWPGLQRQTSPLVSVWALLLFLIKLRWRCALLVGGIPLAEGSSQEDPCAGAASCHGVVCLMTISFLH